MNIHEGKDKDPDQARYSGGPDLDQNYLHGLSADSKSLHLQGKSSPLSSLTLCPENVVGLQLKIQKFSWEFYFPK